MTKTKKVRQFSNFPLLLTEHSEMMCKFHLRPAHFIMWCIDVHFFLKTLALLHPTNTFVSVSPLARLLSELFKSYWINFH